MTTLAITGHRLGPKLGGYEVNPLGRAVQWALRDEMRRLFREGVDCVRVGMATGVDQWAGWVAHHACIPFTAALPFDGHHRKWTSQQQAQYHQLLLLAADVVVVTVPETAVGEMSRWAVSDAMQKRNEWMVDNSDVLLAVWDGEKKGGTWNCIQYARKVGRTILTVDVKAIRRGLEVRT